MNCLSVQNEVGGLCNVLESRSLPECFKKKDDREFVVDNVTGSHLLVTISCPNLSNRGFPQPGSTWEVRKKKQGQNLVRMNMWLSCSSQVGTKDPVLRI